MRRWTGTPLLIAAICMACSGGDDDTMATTPGTVTGTAGATTTTATASVPGPGLVAASLAKPGTDADHLTRVLSVTTDVAATVTARMEAADGTVVTAESTALGTEHTLSILGLHFGKTWTGTVDLTAEDGATALGVEVGEFATDPQPSTWPDIQVVSSDPAEMESGVTLMAMNDFTGGASFLIVLDAAGEVIWMYDSGPLFALDAHVDDQGIVSAILGNDLVQLEWLGNVQGRWNADGARGATIVNGTFHHEAYAMPSGNLLSLTRDKVFAPDFPDSYQDSGSRAPSDVMSHKVVEFEPDGTVVFEYSLWDVLDRERICYDGLDEANGGGYDWVHSNAVFYEPTDDSYIVSLRHQDALIKMDRQTGALVWILGNHDNWGPEFQSYLLTPDPGTEWPFHPHGPMRGNDDQIYVFDNGNYRVSPWTGDPIPQPNDQYSRLVSYEVDEVAMTVRQTWDFDGPGDSVLFSYATGDADLLPQTGNVLGTFGLTEVVDGINLEDMGLGRGSARIIEVDPATDDVVWDVWLTSDVAVMPEGWHGYRATRIDFP